VTHPSFSIVVVPNVPMVTEGDDLVQILEVALDAAGLSLQDGDVVCLAQKIVSKAEGRLVALADVSPSERAKELARETDKDPRLVELILQESSEVLRQKPGVLIMRHRLGLVGAHAGIDQSNIEDSTNRPWRLGTVGTAIGAAGLDVLADHRGGTDLYGRELKVTLINRADALAGAATLAMGETVERTPVVLIRGLAPEHSNHNAQMINRPLDEDLFR